MSASLKTFGSNFPVFCISSSGKIWSFWAWSKCGNSHSRVNSARFWYHHHTASQMPLASHSAMVSAQCTSVYAATLLVVTRVIGVGLAAAARYCLIWLAIFWIGCMIENDSSPSPRLPATTALPSLVAAIHAGGGGCLKRFGVSNRRLEAREIPRDTQDSDRTHTKTPPLTPSHRCRAALAVDS